ncbi:ABC transporter substrate-binding protein [Desulfococcaceae bacterium HSG8]|nr:ABC transporter substrate-binding protein [Desulfococcaceae bacterium HSG8]
MKNVCAKLMMCLLIVAMCSEQGIAKEPLQPLTIQLDYFANVQCAGILLAKERGWYEEKGIDLTIREWKKGISPDKEVVAGKAQIGVAAGALLIKARAEGTPLKAIAVQFQKSPLCLLSKKEKRIKTPEDLKGKKIGVTTPKTILMTKIVLANEGLHFDDIITVRTGGDLRFLIDDEIVAFTCFMNNHPLIMKAKGYEVTNIPAFKYGYDFYSKAYITTEAMIRGQPKLIQNFLDVTLHGWREAYKDLPATAQLVVEKYYPKGSVSQQTESLKVFKFLARLGEGRQFLGWMEEEYWAKGIDILHKFKQIDKKIPAADVFTLKFLESVYFGKKE